MLNAAPLRQFGRNCLLAAPTAAPNAGREKTEKMLPPSGGKRTGGATRAGKVTQHRPCKSLECVLGFIQEEKHHIRFSGYLQHGRKRFSAGDFPSALPMLLGSAALCCSSGSHAEHRARVYVHRGRMDLPNSWCGEAFVCRKVFSSVSLPDADLLLQCSGSSAWTFPAKEILDITLQGDNRLCHCRLGEGAEMSCSSGNTAQSSTGLGSRGSLCAHSRDC